MSNNQNFNPTTQFQQNDLQQNMDFQQQQNQSPINFPPNVSMPNNFPPTYGGPPTITPQFQMGTFPNQLPQMTQLPNAQGQMTQLPNAQGQMNQFPNAQGQMNQFLNPQGQMNQFSNPQGQMNQFPNPQGQMTQIPNTWASPLTNTQMLFGSNSIIPPNMSINPSLTLPSLPNPRATVNTSTKEKQLQSKIIELEEQIEEQEKAYNEKITKEKKSAQVTTEHLKKNIHDLEEEIYDQNQIILQLKQDINNKQQTIDRIQKEKNKVDQEKIQLEDDLSEFQQQLQTLSRRSVNQQSGSTQQQDQSNSQFYDAQIKKLKDEQKKQREESSKQKNEYEKELSTLQLELEKSQKQSDKEHQYFMEARDEIAKLQKIIKSKDENMKKQDVQQNNIVEALRNVNIDKQRLEDNIKQKDFEILALKQEIELLKNQVNLLKDILKDAQQGGKNVKLDQNQKYKEYEKQQQLLNDQKQKGQQLLQQELSQNEQIRKERVEKEKKKKEEYIKQQEIKKGNLLQKGNEYMNQAKKEYGQLDVCFIVDVTGSMDSYKDQTRRSVQGSLKIIKQATNRETNWASVCYQDKAELLKLGKYYEFPFSKDQQELEKWFDGIKCSGGGDAAEDIRGAIKQVCKLNWPSRFRIAIIICDAPCHGKKYNGGCGDDHPGEDIQDAIEELIEKNIVLIALNFTKNTTVMYEQIKLIYESKKRQDLFLYQDLQKMNQNEMANTMTKYIGEASQNATQTNKNQTKSKQGAVQQEIPREKEGAMEALCKQGNFYNFDEQKDVKTVNTKFQVWRVEIKDDSFNKNVETIEKIECPQDFSKYNEGSWDCIRTEKPFAFGMMKDVFLMKKKNVNSDELYVIKTPIGSQPYKTMDDALKECKSHLICQKLMKRFVAELQESAVDKQKNVKIPAVIYSDFLILEESKNSFWIAERFFKGEFVKYNNNYGYINEEHNLELNKFAQSFTYYTYFISSFNYMVSDVQGVGNYFTDPAINTQRGNFDETDMGQEGKMMYLVNYENKKALLTFDYLDLLGIYE